MTRCATGVVVVTALLTIACGTPPPASDPAPAATAAPAPAAGATYTPVVSLNEIMVYVVDPHANEIWDAAVKPPTTDAAWTELHHAAVVLAASGNLTKLSGNGPKDAQWIQQEKWTTHSQTLADAGLAAVRAASARDAQQLARAGDQLVLTCINCHREYKLDVPKVWTERQLPPEEQQR
jgi:hypothetical protein